MDFRKYIFSRGLPKTGQETVFYEEDDGTYQTGWWRKRVIDINRTRFIAKTINGDLVVFDRATGLMWAGDGNEKGCNNGAPLNWEDAINDASTGSLANFGDWRVPNINELLSLIQYDKYNPPIDEPPFSNTALGSYWTSTTYSEDDTKAWVIPFIAPKTNLSLKTAELRLRCVRLGV